MNLPYSVICDVNIGKLAVEKLQDSGLLFLWVTAHTYPTGVKLLKHWG
jgi:mRNA (2'-O-methyladenosine-N6-)-methyltransferase